MPLGRRQLFIYWRVVAADAGAARVAAQDMQRALVGSYPELRAGLFLRSEASAAESTLMETYGLASRGPGHGIDTALQQQIEAAGAQALQPWLQGARHVEVFEACGE